MNLVVDFGNSRIKAAVFNGRDLFQSKIFNSVEEVINDKKFYEEASLCMIASVTEQHLAFIKALYKKCKLLEFTSSTKSPLKNAYKSTSTLGSDRLAASVGAFSIYPNKNILVIDAGTCLKFNFINANGEYLGGAISPGFQMRFKSLNHFTKKLPLINLDENFDKLIGQSTEESILSGVINGIISETDGIIDSYKKQFPDLVIAFTGGDCSFFAKRLKSRIFAHPELILTGLNEILIYNS